MVGTISTNEQPIRGCLVAIPRTGWGWLGRCVAPRTPSEKLGLQSLGRVGGGWDQRKLAGSSGEQVCCNPSDGLGVVGTVIIPICGLGHAAVAIPRTGWGWLGRCGCISLMRSCLTLQSLGRVGGGWDNGIAAACSLAFPVAIPRTGWGWLGQAEAHFYPRLTSVAIPRTGWGWLGLSTPGRRTQ